MKTFVVWLVLLFAWIAAFASISSFQLLDIGKFAGKPAAYVSGDTIVYVLRSEAATPLGIVKYYYSYDGGSSWNWSQVIPTASFEHDPGLPTLCYTPAEKLVATQNRLVKSLDGGNTWQNPPTEWSGTFDNSPIVEKRAGQYKLFHINQPYPQDRQDEFVIPGTSEFQIPQALVEKEGSTNGNPLYYWGPDVFQGPVRTNENLYIRQMGGGTNNGWPTFLAPVVVGGVVISSPADYNYPVDQVFQGGLIENAPQSEMPDTSRILQNATVINNPYGGDNNIYLVEVSGDTYNAWLGKIEVPRRVFTDVWTIYPGDIESPPIFRNNFTICDTTWYQLPTGTCANQTLLVEGKLWIKGVFSGKQTWCATDSLFIIGDISLTNTILGESPENNSTDFVNLISEKSILIKYGYRNPADSLRVHPLCAADDDPHRVYASLFALGDGNGNTHKDGVFTFEYQHPHGSVPALWLNYPGDEPILYDWIDLHRNHWPQTSTYPWPGNLDYPWYNPLWPERSPYLERGTIQQWGSVTQTRKGYLHRNYYDQEYPSGGVWNPEIDYCGSTSNPSASLNVALGGNSYIDLITRNFPGATGTGMGYKKDFYADPRNSYSSLETSGLEGFWRMGLSLASFSFADSVSDYQTYYLKPQTRKTYAKSFARKGLMALYSVNDLLLSANGEAITDISNSTSGDGNIVAMAIGNDNTAWITQLADSDPGYLLTVKQISPDGTVLNTFADIAVSTKMNDITVLPNGRVLLATLETTGQVQVIDLSKGDESVLVENWQLIDAATNQPLPVWEECKLYLMPSGLGGVEVFAWLKHPENTSSLEHSGNLYFAKANFPVSNDDPMVPEVTQLAFAAYPNPMTDELKLNVELSHAAMPTIEIYNLKGQLVQRFAGTEKALKHTYMWNGMDKNQRTVGSGIYLIKLKEGNKTLQTKRICKY